MSVFSKNVNSKNMVLMYYNIEIYLRGESTIDTIN